MNHSPTNTWRVFKFGGASVKDADAVRNAVSLVEHYGQEPLAVVVSAMAKTTNALESVVQALTHGQSAEAEALLAPVVSFHREVVHQLGLSDTDLPGKLHAHWQSLLQAAPTPYAAAYDAVVGGGEWASAHILVAALVQRGLPARWADARNSIITSAEHRRASVDFAATTERLAHWPASGIVVTQGFVGATADGVPTTLGREGSDYTAAVLAHCLEADEVTIWKDVPGVLSGDPRYFPNPVQLNEIPYREAVELAYYGASVIHPKTIQPLQAKGIENARQRFPDIAVRVATTGKRAGTGDFHNDIGESCQRQQLRQFIKAVFHPRRLKRLLQTKMINHEPRIRITPRQFMHLIKPAPTQQIDGQIALRGGGQHVINAGVRGVCRNITAHHDANGNRARGCLPIRNGFRNGGIIGINRLHQSETIWIGIADRNRIAGIEAIHGEGGNQYRAIHANRIHRLHHIRTRHFRRAMQHRMPGPARVIAFIGMDLGVNDWHVRILERVFMVQG